MLPSWLMRRLQQNKPKHYGYGVLFLGESHVPINHGLCAANKYLLLLDFAEKPKHPSVGQSKSSCLFILPREISPMGHFLLSTEEFKTTFP